MKQLRKLAFKIVNSTTKLAPVWRDICKELSLEERMIPRDVRTRWNSTYDMIKMAIEYSKAIKRICSDADNGLRDFELSTEEWKIAEQL